jgi:serine protease AprX
MNNVARGILGLPDPVTASGLMGEGQTVAVADTGFDMGTAGDVHPAFAGRVKKLYPWGRPGQANDPKGHGTHVAGSVLGDGKSDVLGIRVTGTAPAAQLVLQSVLDATGNLGGLPPDLHDLFLPPYRDDGAHVHTNSWGARNSGGIYNSNSQEVDDFVWNHRDCVVCFAAGNEGVDSQGVGRVDLGSCTPPGTAKNCITVGATENSRPGFANGLTHGQGWPKAFRANPIASDRVADNPEGMVAFSGRGPVQSGRNKPDVTAPGTAILSTRSRATASTGWEMTADPLYFFNGGTSMATPLVAGCAAVVREYLMTAAGIAKPSAALIKAMLINGAVSIKGQYAPAEIGPVPDASEGYGRVNMPLTIGPFAPGIVFLLKDEATQLDTGEREEVVVTVSSDHTLLKATLVWTDPPGQALQNDLDLIVRASSGEERHGNVPPGSTDFDRVNNVEQVTWVLPPGGTMTVTVRAFHVTLLPQSYALLVRVS